MRTSSNARRSRLLALATLGTLLQLALPAIAPALGSALAQCRGPGSTIPVSGSFANNTASTQSLAVTFSLPVNQLLAITGSCTTSTGTCNVVNASTITVTASLPPFQAAFVSANAQVADSVAFGVNLAVAISASLNGGPPSNSQQVTNINCVPPGPGTVHTIDDPTSVQRTGSVLLYPVYTSSTAAPTAQFTRIALTNTEETRPVSVRLFFVDGATGGVTQAVRCLGAEETTVIAATAVNPNVTGFVVAVAVDPTTGCPISFNHLTGSATVGFSTGHRGTLPAQAVGQIAGGLPACNASSTSAQLSFAGSFGYSALPRVLTTGGISSRADGNDTLLIVNRIGGNYATTGSATLGTLFGSLLDDSGAAHSFTVSGGPQLRAALSNAFPRTVPRFEKVIPSGHTGALRLWSSSDFGVIGAVLNANALAATDPEAFNDAYSLHAQTLGGGPTLTIPVAPATCP